MVYRGRSARISTGFFDGKAHGRLVADGLEYSDERELVGPEAVPELLLLLLMESDPAPPPAPLNRGAGPHHPARDTRTTNTARPKNPH